jgi:hypothetical protein
MPATLEPGPSTKSTASSSRNRHGTSIPLLYASLAALHAGGSPHDVAAAIIYLGLALEHILIEGRRPSL